VDIIYTVNIQSIIKKIYTNYPYQGKVTKQKAIILVEKGICIVCYHAQLPGPNHLDLGFRLHGGNEFISLMNMFSTDVVSDQHWTVIKLGFPRIVTKISRSKHY
jgi:hypothetical protein